ncbi:cell wall anchor protein [Listeria monocytogenes]|uniref:SpaA isopeptide-forming pilin-related protein n=1 Tax=Listeria monocytogenes TaxID=1639 RepID=UPI000BDF3883|nr:SpaA isopeptide-forming pilin-related protein [Listeria monocytogenes]PCV56254.1 cell wall anchor protein [Listeria monocytogenes]
MKNFSTWKKLIISMVIGLLVFHNVSPVIAALTDDKAGQISLKIVKEDKDTKEKINGSTFEVKNVQTGETKELSIKDKGTITDVSITQGEYIVKEMRAPQGYLIDETVYKVTLNDKEELVTSVSSKSPSVKKGNLKASISDNIFTKVELQDVNGNQISSNKRVENGSGVILNMNFSFSGKNYKSGDTFKTILPDTFNFGSTDLSGNFLPSTEAEWSFDASSRELTIKFLKDGVQEGNYDVGITTAFRSFTETDKTNQNVVFNTLGMDTVYEYEIIPSVDYPTIVDVTLSPGLINPEKALVTAKLNLTKEANAVGELRLTDFTYSGSTKIDKDTLKIYASDVSAKGTFIGSKQLLEEGKDYTVEATATELNIKLSSGLNGKGYEVSYTRLINKTSNSLVSIATRAQTVGDSKVLSVRQATVEAKMINYKHLEKKAFYNSKTQTIDWAINVNYDRVELTPNTVLKDVLADNGVSYVPNSLKINEVTFSPTTGNAIIGDEDVSSNWTTSAVSANGSFETRYKNTDKKAYQITYSTKVTDFSVRDIINEVTDENGVKAQDKLSFEPNIVKKESGTVDYFNNLMSWKITANTDRIEMSNMTIIDEFSTGVKSLDNYDVYAYSSETDFVKLVENVDYKITETAAPKGFKVELIGNYTTTDKEIVVKLVTNIDPANDEKTLENKAYISYYDGYITHYSDTKEASLEVDSKISENGAKFGEWDSYKGTTDWIVSLNSMATNFDNLIFDDEMPEGTSYVEGSLEFRQVAGPNELINLRVPLTSTGKLVKEGDKNYPTKIETTDKKIHLEFGNLGNSQVFVKYKTTADNKWHFYETITNVAKVSDNGENQKDYSAEASIFETRAPISKTGKIDMLYNNKINWKIQLVDITEERIVTNPVVTDTLNSGVTGAQIVKNSFKVIDTKTGNHIEPKYYDITFNGNSFTVQFKNYTATAPISITYDTISLLSGPVVNTGRVDAKDYGDLSVHSRTAISTIIPNFTMGSGSGITTIGSLEINKVDKADITKKLEGAKFQLYTLDGEKSGQEATTNAEGKIIFDSVQSGKYKLVETEAPTGYSISEELKEGKEVTVNADGSLSSYTIENEAKTGSVVLTKLDSITKAVLAGAEFELQKADGSKIKSGLITNTSGELTVTDLAPGDYQLIETKAPTGYVLDTEPVNFEINFNQTEAVSVTKENTAKSGSVILTKKDSETGSNLADAEFKLQTTEGTTLQSDLVTDVNGKLEITELAVGDYQLVETKAPAGYTLDTAPVNFTIAFNQNVAASVTKENVAKTGSVILTKKDNVLNTTLADAKFELQTANGTKIKEALVTGVDGKLEVADLAPGDYQLVETEAPMGYQLDTTPLTFTIEFNQAKPLNITKENTLKTGSVILTKQASGVNTLLADATFELQKADGTTLKENLVTDAAGQLAITNLTPGNYQLVETKAPVGYQLDATPVPFTILFNQTEDIRVTKENTAKTGSVVLTKLDAKTAKTLAGAKFELQTKQGDVLKTDLSTDASGQLIISDLITGEYRLVETEAPTDYELDRTPVEFSIIFNQQIPAQVTKTNKKKTGIVKVAFMDTNNNPLAEAKAYTDDVGELYSMTAPNIDGYTLTKEPTNKAGMYKENTQEVIFVYEKNLKDPVIPVTPAKPAKPTKPFVLSEPPTNLKPYKSADKKQSKSLPSTGDTIPLDMIFCGFLVSAFGLFLFRKNK